MKKKESNIESFEELVKDTKSVNLVFLGVGLILFMLNISSFLAFMPNSYSYMAFDLSVFSSVLIILIAVYNVYERK